MAFSFTSSTNDSLDINMRSSTICSSLGEEACSGRGSSGGLVKSSLINGLMDSSSYWCGSESSIFMLRMGLVSDS